MEANVPWDKIRFCFPPMQGPGNMHSKLQLLKYSDYLRIVVPTGNFVPYDWGETGVMENARNAPVWFGSVEALTANRDLDGVHHRPPQTQ
jgi:hypothetical protein